MRKRLAAKPDTAVPRYSRTQLVTLRRIVTDEAVMKLVETSEVIRDEEGATGRRAARRLRARPRERRGNAS
jgi:hypothetical protein